ncbi:MAG TPA: RraA family protein [Acidobacteriota bacterium]|nr:RraA family protein [Acidobacteriota bacterium]HRV07518.1 RraA family protein [Acidobacteriota bacterium]
MVLTTFVMAAGVSSVQAQGPDGLPLVYEADFSSLDDWYFTDPAAWALEEDDGKKVLALKDVGTYEPPVRSPANLALVRDLWVSDFVLEVKVRSTKEEYPHRDLCFFFGWQSPARFYYAHLASAADPHAHSIFLVNDAPRVSIAAERTEGVQWGDGWHTVRIERDTAAGTIRVFFDDMTHPVMAAEDRTFTFGRLGVGSFDDTGRFSDLKVWARTVDPKKPTDEQLLVLYEGLRVSDVSDGMDVLNLADVGLLDPEFQPLWRDLDNFSHQIRGIALTVRYVPTNRPRKTFDSREEFSRWESEWYQKISPEPFVDLLKPGTVIVIDGAGDGDTGTIGSFNSLAWKQKGAVGVVTSGGVRDTDEVIKEKVPIYLRRLGRGIRPGRNEIESVNQPVQLGGVLIRPGDVVVADGDGVVVVPREFAVETALAARRVLDSDKAARRDLYRSLGLPEDPTVKP